MSTSSTLESRGQLTAQDRADLPSMTPPEDLPIGVLHLGVKTEALERAGFRKVGDLANVSWNQIVGLAGIGWRTADLLNENRLALLESFVSEAGTDWDSYCAKIQISLLPAGSRPASGKEFLACLPDFFREIADSLADETLASILRERICMPPAQQKTLDEIAAMATPSVTRQRIQQKEKKLLSQLAGGLLNDNYGALDMHFRPEFAYWWKRAADSLSHLEEIDFGEFVSSLSEAWDVSNDAVLAQLPVILAIVTGEPQMSGDFRVASRIDPRLFGNLSEEVLSLPLIRLRLGRHAESLSEEGAETVGDILERLRKGDLASLEGKAARVAVQQANLLASCLCDNGLVDWQSYRKANGLTRLPTSPVSSPGEFVATLCSTVVSVLQACGLTKRAPDIYCLRTSRTVGSQMTLQAVAEALETYPPTIKREETTFLSFLNEALICHNFSRLPVWLDDSWLCYWDEAKASFEASRDDYENFSENLAWKWRITAREVEVATPTIWAVLSGYPSSRRSKRTARNVPIVGETMTSTLQLPAGRIRLRGFRRLH